MEGRDPPTKANGGESPFFAMDSSTPKGILKQSPGSFGSKKRVTVKLDDKAYATNGVDEESSDSLNGIDERRDVSNEDIYFEKYIIPQAFYHNHAPYYHLDRTDAGS